MKLFWAGVVNFVGSCPKVHVAASLAFDCRGLSCLYISAFLVGLFQVKFVSATAARTFYASHEYS